MPKIRGGLHQAPSNGPGGEVVEAFFYCGLAPVLLALAVLTACGCHERRRMVWPVLAVGAALTLAFVATSVCLPLRLPGWRLGPLFPLEVGSVPRTLYDNPDTTYLFGAERRAEVSLLHRQDLDPQTHRILHLDLPLCSTAIPRSARWMASAPPATIRPCGSVAIRRSSALI